MLPALASALGASPAGPMAVVLAHQGGWDEILMVAGPILVIVIVLRIVKRRVDAAAAAGPITGPDGPDGIGPSDDPPTGGPSVPSDDPHVTGRG